MPAADRSIDRLARSVLERVRTAFRQSSWLFATVFLAAGCAIGWTWTVWKWNRAESSFELERTELRDEIEDARTVAIVESHHQTLQAVAESSDGSADSRRAHRDLVDRVEVDLKRLVEAADRRPTGTLAAERGRLELARLLWRERREPANAAAIYSTIIERLARANVPAVRSEERAQLLEAAYHGRFHTILESQGGAELVACLEAWARHLEPALEQHRGAPWLGHAWTRFAVANGIVAGSAPISRAAPAAGSAPISRAAPAAGSTPISRAAPAAGSRATPGNENALRHYRAALASPPTSLRDMTAQAPEPSTKAEPAQWSARWLPVSFDRFFHDEWLEDRCEVLARLARAEFLAGDYPAAVGLQREAVAARFELRTRAATRRRRWLHLRDSHTLGVFHKAAGELAASRATLEAALEDSLRLVAESPEWPAPRRLCRELRDALAIAYQAAGEDSRALDLLINATIALSALPLDREPVAVLDDQAVIREELLEAHATAGRKSLAWRNAIEAFMLRDAIWRRSPSDDDARQQLLRAAQATLDVAVTPAEWRESLSVVDPLLDRLDADRAADASEKRIQAALGQLYFQRGNALQAIHGDAEARVDLVEGIRASYTRARELFADAGKLAPELARDLDNRLRACDAVIKKLESKQAPKVASPPRK
jgi:tetratricopeptide (TPR) repeat protein